MNLNAKYDVFISYSRKDYVDEAGIPVEGNAISELMDFLENNGISYWFDKEGISGGSEFLEIIADAIADSKMMIFVSSKYSNASPWTKGEIIEALDQKIPIVPLKIDNSLYSNAYRMVINSVDFIEYFTNPDVAFRSLLKAINGYKEEYAQRRAKIVEEIKSESLDFLRHAYMLDQDAQRLVEKQKLLGIKEKKCPVCSTVQSIGSSYCRKCGWTFNPLFDAHPEGDKDHIFVIRSLWNTRDIRELDDLRKENDALKATIQELQQQLKDRGGKEKRRDFIPAGNIDINMIRVEGGTFTMGEGSDEHQVTLSSYSVSETLVTQELWKEVMGTAPSRFRGDLRPVESVSWNECQKFIKKLNEKTGKAFRLLTEAEWEFASRGGNASQRYEYSGSNNVDDVAWYSDNSGAQTHPVKQKAPNELGLYDMSGNVWEWCQDWCGNYGKGPLTDPTGPSAGSGRVIRGGGWNCGAKGCGSSCRSGRSPGYMSFALGFRLALSD